MRSRVSAGWEAPEPRASQSLSYLWTQNPHSSTKQETLQEYEHPWIRIMLIINPRFSRNIPILNITSYPSEYVAPVLISIQIHYQTRKSCATISLLNTHLGEERWRDEERGLLNISHVTLGFCLQISLRGQASDSLSDNVTWFIYLQWVHTGSLTCSNLCQLPNCQQLSTPAWFLLAHSQISSTVWAPIPATETHTPTACWAPPSYSLGGWWLPAALTPSLNSHRALWLTH